MLETVADELHGTVVCPGWPDAYAVVFSVGCCDWRSQCLKHPTSIACWLHPLQCVKLCCHRLSLCYSLTLHACCRVRPPSLQRLLRLLLLLLFQRCMNLEDKNVGL